MKAKSLFWVLIFVILLGLLVIPGLIPKPGQEEQLGLIPEHDREEQLDQVLVYDQTEQGIQYRYSREAQDILKQAGIQIIASMASQPEGVTLPDLGGKKTACAKWATPMAKAGYRWLLLANENPKQLYFDSDGDDRLDDEVPLKAYRRDTHSSYFGPIEVVFETEDGPASYHLNIRYYGYEGEQRFYIYAAGWYEGMVTIGGKQWTCALVDQNVNGIYDDRSLDSSQADRISVSAEGAYQFRLVGKYLQLDESLYEIEVSRERPFVVFTEAQGVGLGEVHFAEEISSFRAGGPNGQFDCIPKAGVVKLPVGQYRIEHWATSRKDNKGYTWQVKGQSFGDTGLFQVSAAQKTELKVGEPLVANLRVSQRGNSYNLNQELKGGLGEQIELLRNGIRPRPPKLHIKDKTGAYERNFSLEYG